MATKEEFVKTVKKLVEEEVARILDEDKPTMFRKVLAASPEIAQDEEVEA